MEQLISLETERELEMSSEKDIAKFIAEKATASIGIGSVIGTSVIVFEFIGADGRAGHGILRQKGTDLGEALELLVGATDTIIDSQEKKFPYDEDYPDDL